MYSNISIAANEKTVSYPVFDSNLPFADYIRKTREIVTERRTDLSQLTREQAELVINANSPFELYPSNPIRTGNRLKYGALLVHGLLDSPFSLRDVGDQLQAHGILSRAILLPGHGTTPSDLLHVSYHDWIQAVRYGIESLRHEVDHIFLVGYSTGAALSVYQALQDAQIAGLILLSPAIKIKTPVDIVVAWHKFTKLFGQSNKQWLYTEDEINYVKYTSIPFNAVTQVAELTSVINELREQHPLITPVYMVISREDETVSSHSAIAFFSSLQNQENKLLLYTSFDHRYPDPRIQTRLVNYPSLNIKHCSHGSIPFAPNNIHYGATGDYRLASHTATKNIIYGAYNRIEQRFFNTLYTLGLTKYRRHELTYNPDFSYMTDGIVKFILN